MEPMVIEVHGVPGIPPDDRMTDKLKIHFLKRRNCGGDVLMVIYPTSTPGQAYVIFESAEVPSVLENKHILEVDNRFYPIDVKKSHLSKVDMPVETSLDLSMFPKPEYVLKRIKYYGFNVDRRSGSHHLQLRGSFLRLKLLRNDLMQLQGHEHQSHRRSPTALHNGSALGYGMESNSVDLSYGSKCLSRNMDKMDAASGLDSAPSLLSSLYRDAASYGSPRSLQSGVSSYTERNTSSPVDAVAQKYHDLHDRNDLLAHRWSPIGDGASSLSADSSSSLSLPHHTSPLNVASASGRFPRSIQSSYGSSIGSSSHAVDTTKYLPKQQQHGHVIDNAMVTHRTSPLVGVPSPSKNSTSSPSMQDYTSYRDSASGRSLRSQSSFDSETLTSERMESFPVDADTINFILTQRPNVVKVIEKDWGTEMVLKYDEEVTMVTFLGQHCDRAKAYLLDTIEMIGPLLRTQELNLKKYDGAERKQILQRIECNKDSGVMIVVNDDFVKLVGFSDLSFEVMQKILGNKEDRGRAMERDSKTGRSSSVPRQFKLAHQSHVTDPGRHTSAAKTYSPLYYQDESDEGKASQVVRGPDQTTGRNSLRTHSNTESRDKTKTSKERLIHQDVGLVSSNQPKKSTDALKFRDLSKTKTIFFNKLKKNKKNPD